MAGSCGKTRPVDYIKSDNIGYNERGPKYQTAALFTHLSSSLSTQSQESHSQARPFCFSLEPHRPKQLQNTSVFPASDLTIVNLIAFPDPICGYGLPRFDIVHKVFMCRLPCTLVSRSNIVFHDELGKVSSSKTLKGS